MRVHIVSDSHSFIDAVGELSLAHGIDYSTYAHLAPLHGQAHVDPDDAVVVDLPTGTKDPTANFELMKALFPKSLVVWFVSTLGFEAPGSMPNHWRILEKPRDIGKLEEVLHLEQPRLEEPRLRRNTLA